MPLPLPLPDTEPRHRPSSGQARSGEQAVAVAPPRLPQNTSPIRPLGSGINQLMVKNLAVSQVILLSLTTALALAVTACRGVSFLDSMSWMEGPTLFDQAMLASVWGRLIIGAVAATPMIYASQLVDQAASLRDASHAHFATTNMVVTLFGRRGRGKQESRSSNSSVKPAVAPDREVKNEETTSTLGVILSSFGLSTLTGVTEEIVFRGYIQAFLLAITHSPGMAWLGQAILFGAGHIHPSAQEGENRVVAATQTFNALFGYGLVYALTGGDLWPCIVAHVLYDMHVLVSSWHNVNCQMDWTEDAIQEKVSEDDVTSLRKLKELVGPSLTSDTLNMCRRFFYAFDEDHKHALSLPNVQRAMSYAFLTDNKKPSTTQVEHLFAKVLEERQCDDVKPNDGRISLSEFLQMLFSLRAQTLKIATSA